MMFEASNTQVNAADIPTALSKEVLTARVGHRPNRRMNVGLERMIPLRKFLVKEYI
jgi:hypothetical protein